jgi:hypothetical protein
MSFPYSWIELNHYLTYYEGVWVLYGCAIISMCIMAKPSSGSAYGRSQPSNETGKIAKVSRWAWIHTCNTCFYLLQLINDQIFPKYSYLKFELSYFIHDIWLSVNTFYPYVWNKCSWAHMRCVLDFGVKIGCDTCNIPWVCFEFSHAPYTESMNDFAVQEDVVFCYFAHLIAALRPYGARLHHYAHIENDTPIKWPYPFIIC